MILKAASIALASVLLLTLVLIGTVAWRLNSLIEVRPEVAYEASGYFNTHGSPPMSLTELQQLDEQLKCHGLSTLLTNRWQHCGAHQPLDRDVVHVARELSLFVARPLIVFGLGDVLASLIDAMQRRSLDRIEQKSGPSSQTARQ